MHAIVYSCPFVPQEWIAAHGLGPRRIMPSAHPSCADGAGVCPYVSAFVAALEEMPDAAGIIVTTVCDQMRRGHELVGSRTDAPVFLMNVPATWQTPAARELYLSELRRLGAFLVGCGGTAPSGTTLADTMGRFDEQRRTLRRLRGHVAARCFSEAIMRFHSTGGFTMAADSAPKPQTGVPLALLGGPLLQEHLALFDIIETHGGSVALDATETGERTLPRAINRQRLGDGALQELADAYFGTIPDVARRPNRGLHEWLKRELKTRRARGVVLVRQVWCDQWHAEAWRIKEALDIPLLDLEVDETGVGPRSISRIEAFLEMIT